MKRTEDGGLFTWAKNAASPRRVVGTDPSQPSIGDWSVTDSAANTPMRQSM
jgi:hypothetical protein